MNLKGLTKEQRQRMEEEMREASIDIPQVGIFWYDPKCNNLFGAVSMDACDAKKLGYTTVSKRHDQVWKKEHAHAIAKNDVFSPFYEDRGPYKTPRGRVFVGDEGCYVKVGKWIENYPAAKELILNEFALPPEETPFIYDAY